MKKFTLPMLILVLACTAVVGQKLTGEEMAIKKVIEDETKYFFGLDYDNWAAQWAHTPNAVSMFSGPEEHEEAVGWKEISKKAKELQGNMGEPMEGGYAKSDYSFHIMGDAAYVTFREDGNLAVRVLEKIDGKWKIHFMGVTQTEEYRMAGIEERMQMLAGEWEGDPATFKMITTGEEDEDMMGLTEVEAEIEMEGTGFEMEGEIKFGNDAGATWSVQEEVNVRRSTDNGKMLAFQVASSGDWTSVYTGVCSVSDNGDIQVDYTDPATNMIGLRTYMNWKDDGRIAMRYQFYNEMGSETWGMSFDLVKEDDEGEWEDEDEDDD